MTNNKSAIDRMVEWIKREYPVSHKIDDCIKSILDKCLELSADEKAQELLPKMGGMVCPKCSTIVKMPGEYLLKEKSQKPVADKLVEELQSFIKTEKSYLDVQKNPEAKGFEICLSKISEILSRHEKESVKAEDDLYNKGFEAHKLATVTFFRMKAAESGDEKISKVFSAWADMIGEIR